eukprot:gene22545-23737_t
MRDFLEFDQVAADLERAAADPVGKARALNRRDLPQRFYKLADVRHDPDGFVVTLDGRDIKTPAKRSLVVPRAALAEAIAAEWNAQGTHIDPGTMPFTRFANSVIDGVADRFADVVADLAGYAGSDLLCYRADSPARLVERQGAHWDPILDWVDEQLGARFLVAEGVIFQTQDPEAIERIRVELARLDPWALAAVHTVTTLTGSVLIALALAKDRLDPEAAWIAGSLEEHWSLEVWGHDEEAAARLAHRKREFEAAAAFLAATKSA